MYEFEGPSSLPYDDEFTVSENYSMEDIKHIVRSWLASPMGAEYIMEVVNERHIKLTKSKHDMKICCVGCVAEIIAAVIAAGFLIGTVSYPYDYTNMMNAIAGIIGVVGVIMTIFIGLFCLRPEKAIFEMRFGSEIPIKIHVHRSGEIQKAAHE